MKKIYHLSSCSTCQRILKELGNLSDFELIDIKERNITAVELDELYKLHRGSYEDFFSRRAMKYRSLGLNEKQLSEKDYRKWILAEYTFLKRPVIWYGDKVFIGNAKKVIADAKEYISAV